MTANRRLSTIDVEKLHAPNIEGQLILNIDVSYMPGISPRPPSNEIVLLISIYLHAQVYPTMVIAIMAKRLWTQALLAIEAHGFLLAEVVSRILYPCLSCTLKIKNIIKNKPCWVRCYVWSGSISVAHHEVAPSGSLDSSPPSTLIDSESNTSSYLTLKDSLYWSINQQDLVANSVKGTIIDIPDPLSRPSPELEKPLRVVPLEAALAPAHIY